MHTKGTTVMKKACNSNRIQFRARKSFLIFHSLIFRSPDGRESSEPILRRRPAGSLLRNQRAFGLLLASCPRGRWWKRRDLLNLPRPHWIQYLLNLGSRPPGSRRGSPGILIRLHTHGIHTGACRLYCWWPVRDQHGRSGWEWSDVLLLGFLPCSRRRLPLLLPVLLEWVRGESWWWGLSWNTDNSLSLDPGSAECQFRSNTKPPPSPATTTAPATTATTPSFPTAASSPSPSKSKSEYG